MALWILSDMHCWHKKLEREGIRPEGFTETLRQNLLATLKAGDLVIDLGDCNFGRDADFATWHDDMPCPFILVRGNHDHRSTFYESRGYTIAVEYFVRKVNGLNVLFSHEPFMPLPDDCDLNIHGHQHLNHRQPEYDENPYYATNRERYHLIEIESFLNVRSLDSIMKGKKPLAPYRKEIENEQGPA